MKEEMEEGHFDKDGHFLWNKDKDAKDAWLENIDWVTIKQTSSGVSNLFKEDSNSSDEDGTKLKVFDSSKIYSQIFEMMNPTETVSKTLQRLGKGRAKLSSLERWKQKKAGIVDEFAEKVTKLTEFCNEILTQTGNMDVYEETYEQIKKKLEKDKKITDNDLDMYADDFIEKEMEKKPLPTEDGGGSDSANDNNKVDNSNPAGQSDVVCWEFKWKDTDATVYGPYNSEQMQHWVEEGYFKDGVLVRKCGAENTNFYTSKRVDFELYL